MAGPSGFVQRFKGKVAFPAGGIYIGGVQIAGSGNDLNTNVGWGTVNTIGANGATIPNGGVSVITSTAAAIYNLANPSPGRVVLLDITDQSSSVMVKVSTGVVTIQGTSTTNGGSTLTNTIKSTATLIGTQIELVGLSSVAYLFNGMYPSTLGHLLFSTTT
jgi:hypothetical protein